MRADSEVIGHVIYARISLSEVGFLLALPPSILRPAVEKSPVTDGKLSIAKVYAIWTTTRPTSPTESKNLLRNLLTKCFTAL